MEDAITDRPDQLPIPTAPSFRLLTAAEFHRLADMPPEVEWFANLSNPSTRRAYENAVRDFTRFDRGECRHRRRTASRPRAYAPDSKWIEQPRSSDGGP